MDDPCVVHVRDRRRQLPRVNPGVPLLEFAESLALNEAAQVSPAHQLCHQIIQVTVLEKKEKEQKQVGLEESLHVSFEELRWKKGEC